MPHAQRKSPRRFKSANEAPGLRACDVPGCRNEGEFRAPKSRDHLTEYYWFCLDHVRNYNRAWDYYKGMTTAEIEAHIRHDTTWRRPRWDFKNKRRTFDPKLNDEFGLFDFSDQPHPDVEAKEKDQDKKFSSGETLDPPTMQAFRVLGLEPPVPPDVLKKHYKSLVKRHHPDANGGDRHAEERLKAINQAYGFLRSRQFAS
jgi:hypothetical protein